MHFCVFFLLRSNWSGTPPRKRRRTRRPRKRKPSATGSRRIPPIFVIIASLLCYALLLKTLGLHLCNFLLSFFLVYYLSKGKWKTALITAVCITLAFYLIFDLSLGLRLPKGKLFKLLKSL